MPIIPMTQRPINPETATFSAWPRTFDLARAASRGQITEPAAGRRAASAVARARRPVREGEVLPNGIRLPKKWPPQVDWEEIQARKPLPEPPYLQSSPVIPIDGALRAQTVLLVLRQPLIDG